ncbi:hypothetical protein CPB83DRAFT_906134 [Crepidotus variabilis]|uniref:F-box domain-containing protein n=1 Tax=Crepidotus variabilis TaxID=179855 RepID=A0A9P6EI42_9AGAR|nr:hypothetical protein CPB83DRAFT_906134 [Crepidotus variabilis]
MKQNRQNRIATRSCRLYSRRSDQEDPFSDSDSEDGMQDDSQGGEKIEGVSSKRRRSEDKNEVTGQALSCGILGLLPALPLDVQLEIFSNLLPKDILSLARTTKVFREMLMTKKATTVWKESREKGSVPDCPPWLSEPAWAALLFEKNCEYCGAKEVVKLDLMILKRFCQKCQNQNAVSRNQLELISGGIEIDVFDLVLPLEQRYTRNHLSQLSVPASSRDVFWIADVQNLHRKQNELQKRVDMGIPGAQGALDDFRAEQKSRCAYITKVHSRLYTWRQDYFNLRRANISERRLRSRTQIKERLSALGHAEQDLGFLDAEPAANKSYIISERKWETLEPLFVAEAIRARATRLENASRTLLINMEARYIAYKKSLHPSQWKFLIPFKLLVVLEPFFVHTTPETPLKGSPEILDDLFRTLPSLLTHINDERTAKLISLLPTTKCFTKEQLESSEFSTTSIHLKLATSVFKCIEGNYLFGIDEVRAHHCGARSPAFSMVYPFTDYAKHCKQRKELLLNPRFQFMPAAATIISKLAEIVGLDPASATVLDLDRCIDAKNDEKSMRFACAGCTVRKERYEYQFYRIGYTWRGLAAHLDSTDAGHNPSFSFTELPLPQAEEIKQREMDQSSSQLKWACALCVVHVNAPQTRELAEKHLIANHACHPIKNPIEPDDLVITDTSQDILGCMKFVVPLSSLEVTPTSRPTDDTRCCRCTRVQDRVRVWVHTAVKDHLRAKHNIASPQVNFDYEYIVIA